MGKILEYVKMALQNILSNKGRSFLTMLGIIIGILSVITIMAIGEGVTVQMNQEIDSVGGGLISIRCSDEASVAGEFITADDLDALKGKVKGVEGVSPATSAAGETVTGKGEFALSLSGVNEDELLISNLDIKRGRYMTEEEVQEGRRVCVISDTDAKRLFGSDDVIGMEVDMSSNNISKSFEIIGVTKKKDDGNFVNYSYEGAPVSMDVPHTALADFNEKYDEFYSISIQGDKTMDSKDISDSVVKILEARHQSAGEEYFQVQSFQDMLQSFNSMFSMVTVFISCVAGISLLVGGIGVMNIMLVSVTERTREIGIRKSLGAKTSSITLQFLAESAILTILGGVIGIVLGVLGAYGICSILSTSLKQEIIPVIKLSTIIGATLFSCAVGLFFGIYPARKAALMSPIEALRRN